MERAEEVRKLLEPFKERYSKYDVAKTYIVAAEAILKRVDKEIKPMMEVCVWPKNVFVCMICVMCVCMICV